MIQTAPNEVQPLAKPPVRQPELLAPAGDWEAMRAAVANGADAVYFGLSRFNARHRAANFQLDELGEVIAYLHGHNVRGYVAFNTLIFSDELPDALSFIRAIASAGVDAVIVQDLGLADLIASFCPGLHVHGSTQMTLTEPLGIEFVRQLGVRRVILARELSVADVRKIRAATDMPIEAFIHGALCISYSGQCLTSEALGGRSANRGQCAQACRLPYQLIVDGAPHDLGDKSYLLSPQDLAAPDLVDELANAGVCSLKIEGRLKSAQYVAATTRAYRAAIDARAAGLPFALSRQQELELAQSFSRGFTHGFFDGVDHQRLVHARFPKSRGVRVGSVVAVSPRGITVELAAPSAIVLASPRQAKLPQLHRNPTSATVQAPPTAELNIGDGIVFDEGHPEQDEQGGRVATITRRPAHAPPACGKMQPPVRSSPKVFSVPLRVEVTFDRGTVNHGAVAVGATVWKTDDPVIRRRLAGTYARDIIARRIGLRARVTAQAGGPLRIEVVDDAGHTATVSWPGPLQLAQKHPLCDALFREQFGRMGDTPYELTAVEGLTVCGAVMVPKSVLNDLRRQAVAMLYALRENSSRGKVADADALEHARGRIISQCAPPSGSAAMTSPSLHVLTRTLDQLSAVLRWRTPAGAPVDSVYCDFEDVRKYKQAVALARESATPIGLATVRIIKPGEEGLLRQLADCRPDQILVRNLAAVSFYRTHFSDTALVGDYSLNIANEITAGVFADRGLLRLTPSYDLSWRQLEALFARFPAARFEQVIHQHMPMFHMEHCVFAHALSDGSDFRTCGRPCESHQVDLRDRAGAAHALIPDVGCRNTVYNAAAQSAAEFIPRMRKLGLAHFRVELLREDASQCAPLLDRYARVLRGDEDGRTTWRQLRVLNQLGVTRGTLEE